MAQVEKENVNLDVAEQLHQAYRLVFIPPAWFRPPLSGFNDSSLVLMLLEHRLGGHWAAAHALWWLEEGSKSQGGHFEQGGVAFQVALPIIIISSPAFESSSSSSPLTNQVAMCRRFPER